MKRIKVNRGMYFNTFDKNGKPVLMQFKRGEVYDVDDEVAAHPFISSDSTLLADIPEQTPSEENQSEDSPSAETPKKTKRGTRAKANTQ